MIIRVSHIRAANLCMAGAREWFAYHDLSWNDFLSNGIPVETVEAIGDPIAVRVTAIARKEVEDGQE